MYYEKMWREGEREHGECCPRDDFRFVVVSKLGPRDFEREIGDALPLEFLKPVVVVDTWPAS